MVPGLIAFKIFCVLSLLSICLPLVIEGKQSKTAPEKGSVTDTYKLLDEGEKVIVLSEQYKDITLVLGNTGAGKSTFTQWIAGKDKKLISVEVGLDTGEFIIEDGNRISGSTLTSKTLFPELVIDNNRSAAFYDCPGFSDTRSTSHDIAATFFNKKLADHANSVKILLVVSYPSVRKGVDRQDFLKALRHTTDLVKNVQKFQSSIALVVTKVDNHFKKIGRNYALVPDENVINNIADFLREVKRHLDNKLECKEERFCKSSTDLVNTLLKKHNEKYVKIGIFRRPDEPGALSDISLMLEGKSHIKRIIYEELKFTVKSLDDFGYTISERSKNDINDLVHSINEKLQTNIDSIVYGIQTSCSKLVNQTNEKLDYFVDSSELIVARSEQEGFLFLSQLRKIYEITSCLPILLTDQEIPDIDSLATKINNTIICLGISSFAGNVKDISTQGKYFSFLQTVSNKTLKVTPWVSLFYPIETCLSESPIIEKYIRDKAENINREISGHRFHHLAEKEIEIFIKMEMNALDFESLPYAAATFKQSLLKIVTYRKCSEFLKVLKGGISNTWPPEWIASFDGLIQYLSKSEKWYTFLVDLYDKFSEYDIQGAQKRSNVDDKGIGTLKIQGNVPNFSQFLEQIKLLGILEYESVKQMEIGNQIQELNHTLQLTIQEQISAVCSESGKLVVKGNFVRFSDITNSDGEMRDFCGKGTDVMSVNIFALNTVFIDRDLNAVGKKLQLSIIAPKWQIVGPRVINLNGSPGDVPTKARSGYYPSGSGSDGNEGSPGGPAGTFLSVASEFINGRSLTVTASGGTGGPGQEGGDGGEGQVGIQARTGEDFEKKMLRDDKVITVFYNQNIQTFHIYGKPGGKGGKGGNGGKGGYGGMKGEVKFFSLGESLDVPTIRNLQGTEGVPGKGGRGGSGGRYGANIIGYYCLRFLGAIPVHLAWCGKDKILPQHSYASSGSDGSDGLNPKQRRKQPEKAVEFPNSACVLNDYKYYLRENLIDRFKRKVLLKFLHKIEANSKTKDVYSTLELVSEFRNLEKQIFSLHDLKKDTVIFFYQSLLNRTIEFAQRQSHTNLKEYNQSKKVLSHLYTATLSKLYKLRVASSPSLIVNVELTIDLIKQDVEDLRNMQAKNNKASFIDRYKEKYSAEIDGRITEADNLIAEQILPEIHEINIKLSDNMNALLTETIIRLEQESADKKQLFQKKRELENLLVRSSIFSAVKIFGQIISCFGTVGSIVGSVTEMACQLDDSLAINAQTNILQLPGGVISNIQSIRSELTQLKGNIITSNFGDRVEKFGQSAVDVYNKYKNDKKRIENIDDAIAEADRKIQKLTEYQSEIHNIVMPVLENMSKDLGNLADELKTKSQVSLSVNKWQVQKYLKDMKLQMRLFTKDFEVQDNLARCFEHLDEVMTTLINAYDLIEQYQYQKQLANYIADIYSPRDNDVDMTDEKLRKAITDLEEITKSNIVLERYNVAVDALKQQTFPFVHLYLEKPLLPMYLESENTFQNLVERAGNQIDVIKSKIKAYKTTVTQRDGHLSCGWFNSNYKSSEPFFVWKNETHNDMISKLLMGKKVVMNADVLRSHTDKDAVKFRIIGINFSSLNSSLSSQMRKELEGLLVNITHLGNSYYKLDNKIYVISGVSQSIQYSFESDNHGDPVRKNMVYDKIKSGDLMLSPYSTWEIQLISSSGITSNLAHYKNNFDLELVGHGCYLASGYNVSNLNIGDYYKEDNILSDVSYNSGLKSPTAEVNINNNI